MYKTTSLLYSVIVVSYLVLFMFFKHVSIWLIWITTKPNQPLMSTAKHTGSIFFSKREDLEEKLCFILFTVLLLHKEANYNKSKRFSLSSKINAFNSNSLYLIEINRDPAVLQ